MTDENIEQLKKTTHIFFVETQSTQQWSGDARKTTGI